MTDMRYQETWIKGKSTDHEAQRSCADRYETIAAWLSSFERRFSVFDLGANLGYFDFRIMEDFDACCVMVDDRPELAELLVQNEARNAVWLKRRMDAKTLGHLALCESFDVALALSVLHHYGNQWRQAFEALRDLAQWVIVEVPAMDDEGSLNGHLGREMQEAIERMDDVVHLASFSSHKSGKPRPMYLVPGSRNATRIIHQTIDAQLREAPPLGDVEITSTAQYSRVTIHHRDASRRVESREFYPGINLWNFVLLDGAWPEQVDALVVDWVKKSAGWHDDLRPWNFIVDGTGRVQAIDTDNKDWRTQPEPNGLALCLEMIRRKTHAVLPVNDMASTEGAPGADPVVEPAPLIKGATNAE